MERASFQAFRVCVARIAVLLLLGALGTSDALSQDKGGLARDPNQGVVAGSAAQSGQRYQIVFSPHVARDTFMIDTLTGRVWQLTQFSRLSGEPVAWEIMERIDGDDDYDRFVSAWGRKKLDGPVQPKTKGTADNDQMQGFKRIGPAR
jgi:hypothetical protein